MHKPIFEMRMRELDVTMIGFNGKFLTASPTGVHRVAEELILAFDRYMVENDLSAPQATVFAPATFKRQPSLQRIRLQSGGLFSGLLKEIPWEQLTLPWLSRNSLLISLCNLGPVLHANAITMIHDAQVHETPQSYSRGFRLWYKCMQPLLGRFNRQILTVSNYSKDQLVKYGVAPAHKITVVHNGCDHILKVHPDEGYVERLGLHKRRYVLALASTQAHKNIGLLLRAFADARLADLTLVLFGSDTRERFEAQGLEVPDTVRFVGRISDEQLVALMQDACAFACPSTTEGFGLPPLEAMLVGCPAIAAPCGALPEVCGDAALFAAPDDAKDWIDHIRHLADDPSFQSGVAEHGRRHAAAFTWDAAARKLAAAVGIAAQPRAPQVDGPTQHSTPLT
jgi:glycosyltransferase involved in cell wall biosynthesis